MKLQIMLVVPAIENRFNLLVPDSVKIKDLLPLLIRGVAELSKNGYASSQNEFLCVDSFELPLDENCTLLQYGVQNGDYLYLI